MADTLKQGGASLFLKGLGGFLGGPGGAALGGLGLGALGGILANNMRQPDPMKYANMLPGMGQQYADQLWQMQAPQLTSTAMQGARSTMQGMRNAMAGTGGMRSGLGQAGMALSRGQYANNLMAARSQVNAMGMDMAGKMMPSIMDIDRQNYQQRMNLFGAALNTAGSGLLNFRKT